MRREKIRREGGTDGAPCFSRITAKALFPISIHAIRRQRHHSTSVNIPQAQNIPDKTTKKVSILNIRNSITYRVWGRYALFSDPITRMGGEKLSYPVPSYQALKGITESIYWKPSILWIVDSVRILNPIRTENKSCFPCGWG